MPVNITLERHNGTDDPINGDAAFALEVLHPVFGLLTEDAVLGQLRE